jgi:hypothetical protein
LFTLEIGEEGSNQDKVAYDVQEWRRNSRVGEGKGTPISRVRKTKSQDRVTMTDKTPSKVISHSTAGSAYS